MLEAPRHSFFPMGSKARRDHGSRLLGQDVRLLGQQFPITSPNLLYDHGLDGAGTGAAEGARVSTRAKVGPGSAHLSSH